MITNLYIDGFNLYYRALKDTPFRWLDLRKLAETLFPQDSINRVCYFTARLDARPGNLLPWRRDAYSCAFNKCDGHSSESVWTHGPIPERTRPFLYQVSRRLETRPSSIRLEAGSIQGPRRTQVQATIDYNGVH